jgi:quercetin dioxygenase-like cupin family protein
MDRREFSALLPALLACSGLQAEAETQAPAAAAAPRPPLKTLSSGTFQPGPPHIPRPGQSSRSFLTGLLTAGNIQLEMHETTQQPGAVHEPVGTHKHNEIWLVREGKAELNINGVAHYMDAGDVGIVTAGNQHWIRNAGDVQLTYFVVTVGPPE